MRTAHSSTPGAFTITPSIGFRLSKLPLFGRDSPSENGANTLPLYTLPFGAVTWRFRLFTSAGVAFWGAGEALGAVPHLPLAFRGGVQVHRVVQGEAPPALRVVRVPVLRGRVRAAPRHLPGARGEERLHERGARAEAVREDLRAARVVALLEVLPREGGHPRRERGRGAPRPPPPRRAPPRA